MSNMSYCRFQNTLSDLRDCIEHLQDEEMSAEEVAAKNKLVKLCVEVAEDEGYELPEEAG